PHIVYDGLKNSCTAMYKLKLYHGTAEENVERVISPAFEIHLETPKLMGAGLYFFERSPASARYYAECDPRTNTPRKGSVIEGTIDPPPDRVLDFTILETRAWASEVLSQLSKPHSGLPPGVVQKLKAFGRRKNP